MVQVTVIIPNWDGEMLLPTCLAALEKQTFQSFHVLVVDNGSKDASLEILTRDFPWVRILRFSKNRGFAAAVNTGIRATGSPFVALLNNDTHVDPKWLAALVDVLYLRPQIAAVAGKMLRMDDPSIIDNAGDKINIVGQADAVGKGEKDIGQYDHEREILSVCGGGCLYRRNVFDTVGLFDENFFAYFEDVDLGLRMRLQGLRPWFTPKAVLTHRRGETSKRMASRKEFLHFRNTWMLVIKNFPHALFFCRGRWWKMPLVFSRTVKYLWSQGMWREAVLAPASFCVLIPSMLKERWFIQTRRTVSFAELERWMVDKPVRNLWKNTKNT
ncbi:MAG: glycosyltransferase family 2 protein [bacterium]|nr:glycosyltransferase family 2 protein [bacterium]